IGRFDERLIGHLAEIEIVGRGRIGAVDERLARKADETAAHLALGRLIRAELEPWRDAGERAREGLVMRPRRAIFFPFADRHALLELAFAHRLEHGRRDPRQHADEVRTVSGSAEAPAEALPLLGGRERSSAEVTSSPAAATSLRGSGFAAASSARRISAPAISTAPVP